MTAFGEKRSRETTRMCSRRLTGNRGAAIRGDKAPCSDSSVESEHSEKMEEFVDSRFDDSTRVSSTIRFLSELIRCTTDNKAVSWSSPNCSNASCRMCCHFFADSSSFSDANSPCSFCHCCSRLVQCMCTSVEKEGKTGAHLAENWVTRSGRKLSDMCRGLILVFSSVQNSSLTLLSSGDSHGYVSLAMWSRCEAVMWVGKLQSRRRS